jgi:glutathione S-transferase
LHTLDVTPADWRALGLDASAPAGDGPFGPLPPVFAVGDARAGWLTSPPATARRPLPAPTADISPTPWSGDRPAAAPATRDRVSRLAQAVADAVAAATIDAGQLARIIERDLAHPLFRLAQGLPGAEQLAARRLFLARTGWLEVRLGRVDFLAGAAPSSADVAFAPVIRAFADGLGDILAPFDPDLADFPRLAAYYDRIRSAPTTHFRKENP